MLVWKNWNHEQGLGLNVKMQYWYESQTYEVRRHWIRLAQCRDQWWVLTENSSYWKAREFNKQLTITAVFKELLLFIVKSSFRRFSCSNRLRIFDGRYSLGYTGFPPPAQFNHIGSNKVSGITDFTLSNLLSWNSIRKLRWINRLVQNCLSWFAVGG
jgi:hypothetical protein